jgi:hypothetical protein
MAQDPAHAFLSDLADYLASDSAFVGRIAKRVAARMTTGKAAAAMVSAAITSKRGPGRPAGSVNAGSSTVDRVLAIVRGGASKRAEICAKARITPSSYSYAIKILKEKGQVNVLGSRRGARVVAV